MLMLVNTDRKWPPISGRKLDSALLTTLDMFICDTSIYLLCKVPHGFVK